MKAGTAGCPEVGGPRRGGGAAATGGCVVAARQHSDQHLVPAPSPGRHASTFVLISTRVDLSHKLTPWNRLTILYNMLNVHIFFQIEDWLAANLPDGASVGVDPFCHTIDGVRRLQAKLAAAGKAVVPLLADGNLVDAAWGGEQPAPPKTPLRVHPLQWAGADIGTKLAALRPQLATHKADVMCVTMLDEVRRWRHRRRPPRQLAAILGVVARSPPILPN